ncbi:hypothetical protein SAMN04487901_12147 [Prevotella communis]|uniref:Nudix hydrolase domain-containing protein n=1 Tax=Prevotella communis TaxID=2913614 RepID=A0A1G8B0P8_9BACT|nr:hypothetical protein [Prevotella communis]SDH26704.1 hypothetical protein SAMN04487901_12147 [Prevotella communis]
MTYNYTIKDSYVFKKTAQSSFERPYSNDVYDCLSNSFLHLFGKDFSNGRCVRLDQCEEIEGKTVLTISPIRFFDFLLTNFLFLNYHKVVTLVNGTPKLQVERFYQSLITDDHEFSFNSIIAKKQLSNLFAISCIITDGERFIITKRNGNVGISNHFYSTTVTGIIDDKDFNNDNPVLSCCKREIAEELGCNIPFDSMFFRHIVCGDDKIQPIALVDVKVDDIQEVVKSLKTNIGFLDESCGYNLCTKDDILKLLANDNAHFTSAGRTHLELNIL